MTRIFAVATGILLLALTGLPAGANGTSIVVKLAFVPGVSSYAPAQGASGEVTLILVEGDVRLTAQGLPRLVNDRYELFLVNTDTAAFASAGKFNATDQGAATLKSVVEKLDPGRFDQAIVTVEPEPDPSLAPDTRIALAGRFQPPPTAPAGGLVEATGTPTGPTIRTGTGEVPITLPRTGWPPSPAVELLLGAAAVAAGAAIAARRRRGR